MLLLPVSYDQTRVIAIVTFPLIAAYWLFNEDFLKKISKQETALIFLIGAITPWGWVLGGEPKLSAFPHLIAVVLHTLFGWFSAPTNPKLWTFQ